MFNQALLGPFRIYRAPGSVAFLNCGSALQPILPKSQCWCIDEVNSKFILQIRRPNYWRIELPVSDPEDQRRAEALRGVFDQILQFEKTECPFKRSFTVDLPERPQTPVKKRPWTPIRRPLSAASAKEVDFTMSPSSSQTTCNSLSTPAQRGDNENIMEAADLTRRNSNSSVSPGPALTSRRLRRSENRRVVDDENRLTWPLADNRLRCAGQDIQPPRSPAVPYAENQILPINEELVQPVSPAHIHPERSDKELEYVAGSQNNCVPGLSKASENGAPLPDDGVVYQLHEGTGYQGDHRKARLRRRAGFAAMRSFTSPPGLIHAMETRETMKQSPAPQLADSLLPATAPNNGIPQSTCEIESSRPPLMRRESEDSFHSVESWHSREAPAPPSPITSRSPSPNRPFNDDLKLRRADSGEKGLNELDELRDHDAKVFWDTASDQGSETSEQSVATAPDHIPRSESDTFSDISAPNGDCGTYSARASSRRPIPSHRTTTSSISVRRRALSPLPPAANLFSPTSTSDRRQTYRGRLETVKKLPLTIIAKTCEMIMGPPSHLITLMLKVAARIAAGQWRGLVYGYNDHGEQIPVQWEYSDGEFSDWSDDEPYMGSHCGDRQSLADTGVRERGDASLDDSQSWGVD